MFLIKMWQPLGITLLCTSLNPNCLCPHHRINNNKHTPRRPGIDAREEAMRPAGSFPRCYRRRVLLASESTFAILSLSVLFFSDKPYVFSDTKSMPLRVFYVYYPFCLCSLLSSMPFFNSHSHSYTSQPAIHATHSSTLLHIYTGNNVERYDIRYVCINFSQYVYSPLRLECCRRRTGWPPTNAPQNSVC